MDLSGSIQKSKKLITNLLDLENEINIGNFASVINLLGDQSPEARGLIQSAYSWAKQELEPIIADHWEAGSFPPNAISSFRRNCSHLLGFTFPKCYGGQVDNLLTSCLITMAISAVDASFATTLLVQFGLCAESIILCGTEHQKQKFLSKLRELEHMGCFCLTEPQSGSDASQLQTIAMRTERIVKSSAGVERKETGYLITGSKRWIGNALDSEVFIVWAKNLSLPGEPVVGFIVQRSNQESVDSIITTKIKGKTSMRILQNADVRFNNAWCPDENVMLDHVGFNNSVGRVLESSRIYVAWLPVGISIGAVEHATKYAVNRYAFLAPLASNQLIQEKLVRMTAMTSAIYLFAERVTKDFAADKCSLPAIAMVKAHNSKVGREVVALAREILGGNGILLEYHIASKFCDLEAIYTYEGTYDINALVCGRAITNISAIKSGSAVKKEFLLKSQL